MARPLAEAVTAALFPVAAEYETALREEIANHRNTLKMLQGLKSGEFSLERLIVSDDGWQIMPAEEEPDGSPNGTAEGIGEPALVG